MIFKEFGNKDKPVIVLLHGGGLSWWSWKRHIEALQDDYFVVAPVIDGHGEDRVTIFTSIGSCAGKLISYINENLGGKAFAICGLSIGAQIAAEVLAKAPHIAQYAVLESALVIPMKRTAALTVPMYKICYELIKKRWFAKMQAKALFIPEEYFPDYYADSSGMSMESLIHMTAANSDYPLPEGIRDTLAKTLILVGERELPIMKRSARLLNDAIKGSALMVLKKYSHGELSLAHPEEYVRILSEFIQANH